MKVGGSILVHVKNVLPVSSVHEDSSADTQHRTSMILYNLEIKESCRNFLSLRQRISKDQKYCNMVIVSLKQKEAKRGC